MTAYEGYVRLQAIHAECCGIDHVLKNQNISLVNRYMLNKRLNKLNKEYDIIINKLQNTKLIEE